MKRAPKMVITYATYPTWAAIWHCVADYKVHNDGNSPGYQEVADTLGMVKSAVHFHVQRMVRAGILRVPAGRHVAHGIELVGGNYTPPANPVTRLAQGRASLVL